MSNVRRSSSWRDQARERIEKVEKLYLKAHPERPVNIKALKKEISNAYPFGQRANHPYKIWLSEVKSCLEYYEETRFDPKQPPKLKTFSPLKGKTKKSPPPPPGQLSLFDTKETN
ncbi:hypothetical protein [Spirulina sp. 06S082]|uniref:hypothetical protein n=1 Tax=Spirulina sp. 06S082 TaxID=3110248 RepID=UPI002B200E91|nr:hypothetical protein [Spirulina sp. 06S082]MEA5469343.1 hypothetical protein [Spirulina sp. 06S082]